MIERLAIQLRGLEAQVAGTFGDGPRQPRVAALDHDLTRAAALQHLDLQHDHAVDSGIESDVGVLGGPAGGASGR